ncbi:leucine-rich repeat LGI family member 4-like, partial [Melozone crissalis]|uniref:leucine-rich repeat LGI family member 4-like n=1 Tax=Melozone crissalis TaxID=40204 RepID=UPI0023DB3D7D
DLRGNALRWLLAWGRARPSPPGGRCRAPLPHLGVALAQLRPQQLQCQRHELRPFQTLPFSSLGAAPASLGGHPWVFVAQPELGASSGANKGKMRGRFRAQSVVNGSSPASCHPVVVADTPLLVVAQPRGGSWVRRRSGSSFVRRQSLGQGRLRRPHAVTSARLGGRLYLGVADGSKGGVSAVFRRASGAFYPAQAPRPWRRDTRLEFLEQGGRAARVARGAARRPRAFLRGAGGFAPHADVPHAPDVYAAERFGVEGGVFPCLARFLGDAEVRNGREAVAAAAPSRRAPGPGGACIGAGACGRLGHNFAGGTEPAGAELSGFAAAPPPTSPALLRGSAGPGAAAAPRPQAAPARSGPRRPPLTAPAAPPSHTGAAAASLVGFLVPVLNKV